MFFTSKGKQEKFFVNQPGNLLLKQVLAIPITRGICAAALILIRTRAKKALAAGVHTNAPSGKTLRFFISHIFVLARREKGTGV